MTISTIRDLVMRLSVSTGTLSALGAALEERVRPAATAATHITDRFAPLVMAPLPSQSRSRRPAGTAPWPPRRGRLAVLLPRVPHDPSKLSPGFPRERDQSHQCS
jgi:hypothetical protein